MQPDPNQDLRGREATQEGKVYVILGTASWSNAYVVGTPKDGKGQRTCFNAELLRQALR